MTADNADNTQAVAVGESAEEFVEKARLRSLFEARDKAAEAVRDAPLRELDEGHKHSGVQVVGEYVKAAVTAYIIEAEPLFWNTETGRAYWIDYDHFKSISLPNPPDNLNGQREIAGPPERMINRQKDQIELSGVGDFVALSTPIAVTWRGVSRAGARRKIKERTLPVGVPRSVSESVFRATNRMLADLNIGLEAVTDENSITNVSLSTSGDRYSHQ